MYRSVRFCCKIVYIAVTNVSLYPSFPYVYISHSNITRVPKHAFSQRRTVLVMVSICPRLTVHATVYPVIILLRNWTHSSNKIVNSSFEQARVIVLFTPTRSTRDNTEQLSCQKVFVGCLITTVINGPCVAIFLVQVSIESAYTLGSVLWNWAPCPSITWYPYAHFNDIILYPFQAQFLTFFSRWKIVWRNDQKERYPQNACPWAWACVRITIYLRIV